MNPEERVLLEQALKLSQENNLILKKLDQRARWAIAWSFLKIGVVVVPVILGFLFLEPYFGSIKTLFERLSKLLIL